MSLYPDSLLVRAVGLSEREVRALALAVDRFVNPPIAVLSTPIRQAAIEHAQSAMEKIAAQFLPR